MKTCILSWNHQSSPPCSKQGVLAGPLGRPGGAQSFAPCRSRFLTNERSTQSFVLQAPPVVARCATDGILAPFGKYVWSHLLLRPPPSYVQFRALFDESMTHKSKIKSMHMDNPATEMAPRFAINQAIQIYIYVQVYILHRIVVEFLLCVYSWNLPRLYYVGIERHHIIRVWNIMSNLFFWKWNSRVFTVHIIGPCGTHKLYVNTWHKTNPNIAAFHCRFPAARNYSSQLPTPIHSFSSETN